MWNRQTKRNLTVLLTVMAVLASGLVLTAWAKKPADKPPGGGGGKEARYTIVDLGNFGGWGSGAQSINESGQVVGYSGAHAFLVTPVDSDGDDVPDTWFRDDDGDGINDLMLDLGTLPGHALSSAYGVNDSGQVVGRSDGEGPARAFLWDSVNGMVDLGSLKGSNGSSRGQGINNSGCVIGDVPVDLFADQGYAFIIVPEDTDGDGVPDTWFRDDGDGNNALMIDLGGAAEGWWTNCAYGINDSGQVVGYSADPLVRPSRAFLVTPEDSDGDDVPDTWYRDDNSDGINDLMIELPPIHVGAGSRAIAINSSGQVAGVSDDHAVLWEVDGQGKVTVTDLGAAKGNKRMFAGSINDASQVVGWWYSYGSRTWTAFLWENGTMTKLIDLLANSEGINGLEACGINEHGEIVGTIYGDGYRHAYIALPIPAAP